MIVLKNIDIELTPSSIAKARQAIEDLQGDLGRAMFALINDLTEKGVEFARMELLMFDRPAVFTGELSNSIAPAMTTDKDGVVVANATYAVYVEYGTGIVGKLGPKHPDQKYQLDVNGHGWEGWVYKGDDGKFHHTYGMEARPFMYNTMRDLELFAEQNGGRIIAEYIP